MNIIDYLIKLIKTNLQLFKMRILLFLIDFILTFIFLLMR